MIGDLYVSPGLAKHNPVYHIRAESKLLYKLTLAYASCVLRPDLPHLCFRYFCGVMLLAPLHNFWALTGIVVVPPFNLFRLTMCPMIISELVYGFAVSVIGTPALDHHVDAVVPLRPKKQVVRPNARRVVAVVQYIHPFGNWANEKLIRPPVRIVGNIINSKLTVSSARARSHPQPAIIGPVDSAQEITFVHALDSKQS